jgi:UDP-glucose 6-dehydrogenase
MDALDLDALVDTSNSIVLNGKSIPVVEPSVDDMLKLMSLSSVAETSNSSDSVAQLVAAVIALVPELKDERLTMKQLNAVVNLIMGMIQSKEEKDLKEQGIEAANPKVEAAS